MITWLLWLTDWSVPIRQMEQQRLHYPGCSVAGCSGVSTSPTMQGKCGQCYVKEAQPQQSQGAQQVWIACEYIYTFSSLYWSISICKWDLALLSLCHSQIQTNPGAFVKCLDCGVELKAEQTAATQGRCSSCHLANNLNTMWYAFDVDRSIWWTLNRGFEVGRKLTVGELAEIDVYCFWIVWTSGLFLNASITYWHEPTLPAV